MKPALLLLLLLAACSHEMPTCKGTPFALNPGQWTPTADDMKAPR